MSSCWVYKIETLKRNISYMLQTPKNFLIKREVILRNPQKTLTLTLSFEFPAPRPAPNLGHVR